MYSPEKAVGILQKHISDFPETLVVLGSGWNEVLTGKQREVSLSYKELFDVEASVPGHEGSLVIATIAGHRTAFMVGRLHMYEGYTSKEVTVPLSTFHAVGLKRMIVTAACGGLNEKYRVGDFVILSDLITLFLQKDALFGGPHFQDMSQVFDPELRSLATTVCEHEKLRQWSGVYCFTRGPRFETPADKRMLRLLGADVVGMSTVPETIMARSLSIDVLGLGFVTNLAFVEHRHEDVLAAANEGSHNMVKLLEGILAKLK
jgi:purine-nucleoside phosphorylase